MIFYRLAKIFSPLFLLLPAFVYAAPPSVTGVTITGSMKRAHTLTVSYTYVANPNPEAGTIIEWISYDDNCGSNPVVISTGTSKTYTLAISDVGKHFGIRVTPRDNTGTLGTPVTYQPWDCTNNPGHDQGANPVLPLTFSCLKADGVGVPVPGNIILIQTGLCSPRTLTWQVEFTGINYRLPLTPPRIIINWGDGNIETVAPVLQNTNETNMAKQTWRVQVPHTFDYDGGSLPSTTVSGRCTYTMSTTWGVGTYTGSGTGSLVQDCSAQGDQKQLFTVWDTEDNISLGTLDVNRDATSQTGVEGNPPAPLPASAENVNICEGDTRTVVLRDASDFNCTPAGIVESIQPNDQPRWIQWVYGSTGTNITTGGGATEKIIIDGVSYDASDLPVYGKVLYQPSPTTTPLPFLTDAIQMPSSAVFGQQFFVTMRSWNTCNAFDRTVSDGDGYNPNQVFNVFDIRGPGGSTQTQAQIAGGAATTPFYANNAPVTRLYTITISDKPDKPVVPDRIVCGNENTTANRTLTVPAPIGGITYRWYATRADALANTGILATNTSYTIPAGDVSGATVYDYFVTASAAFGCISDPDTVYFTRRASFVAPTSITGPADICPNSTYVYRVSPFVDPAALTPGGATQYIWTVPAGWTLNSGQGTKEVSVTSNGTLGAVSLAAARAYVTPASSGSQCEASRSLSITVHANPTSSPVTPVNLCQGASGVVVDGNPSNPFGTITNHLWSGSTAILSDPNIQNPTILTSATPGAYALTYTVTNSIGCSGSANVAVNINATPTPATTGTDQLLCQASLTSNALGGSNPAPGTGTWTLISKPVGSTATNAGFSNQSAANATFTADRNGQYTLRWTVVNGTCTSSDDIVVDFGTDPGPQDAGPVNAFCGTTGALAAVAPTIGTGTWTQVGGPIANNTTFANANSPTSGISLNTTTAAAYGTYTYRWTVTSGTCAVQTDDVSITFSRPATAAVPADFTTCIDPAAITAIALTGTTSGTVGNGAGAGQTGRWERVSGSGTFGNGTNPGAASAGPAINDQYTPSLAEVTAGTVQLRVVAIDPDGGGPCANVNSATLTITLDRKPTVADAGTANPICNGDVATLTATPVTNGTGVWSAASGTIANINNASTTVTGLTANTTFTWTVKSTLGALASPPAGSCATTTDNVVVTVRPLPNAIDSHPQDLCETNEGTFTAIGVTLSAYNDGVTGIAGSAQRTVIWYASAFDQLNDINAITTTDINNGEVLFTRVIDTSTPESCSRPGQVTFTINPKPLAVDKSLAFCEEAPAGSDRVNDIDLTDPTLKSDITGAAINRDVFWYTSQADAEADANRIATPADVDIIGDSTVFARVVNTLTGCFNVAQVNLVVKPLPADQPILGSSTPCVTGTELYRVGQVSGAEYVWTLPPQFTPLGGGGINGGVNDFYVLFEFPVAATADVAVQIVLNGCPGNILKKTIAVSNTPPGFSVLPPPETICENGTFAFKVSPDNTGSSSYNWEVLKQSDGTPGGGVVANGQTTGSVLVTFQSEDVILRVTESNASGCAGPSEQLPVVVRKRPVMDNRTESVCGGDAIAIQLSQNASSPVVATAFDVQVPSILPGITPISGPTTGIVGPNGIENDAYRNQTIAPVLQLLYRVKPVSGDGCYGDEKSVIVNIKAEPLLDATAPSPVCSGIQTGVTLKSAVGFFPADKFIIDSIKYDNTLLTPLTALPTTGVLVDKLAIFSNRWENRTGSDAAVIYYVRPFSSVSGCFGNPPVPVQVIVQSEPLVTPLPSVPPICSGDVLSIALTSSNTATPQFVWTVFQVGTNITGATGSTTNTINDQLFNTGVTLDSVTYKVVASDLSSSPVCSGPAEFVKVRVRPSPSTNNLTDIVCSDTRGGNTFQEDLLSLQPSISSDPGVVYTWFTDANDFPGSQIPPAQLNAYSLTDAVTVYVRVENGVSSCAKDAEVKYTVNPTPQLTATPLVSAVPPYNISCNGKTDGQINVSALYGTGHTFSKDDISYIPAVAFSSLGQGTYIIRVINAEGCKDSVSVAITEPPAITFTTGAIDATCFNDPAPNGQITVTGAGGAGALRYFLLQDPSNTTGTATGNFTGLRAGSYVVRIEDDNSCSKITPAIPVGQPTELKLTIDITSDALYNGYDVSCAGISDGEISVLTTTGGTPGATGYTYVLDQDPLNVTGQTSGVFQGLSANVLYTITVFDENSCQKTSLPEFLIDPIPLFPGVVGFDKNVCAGGDPTAFQELATPFGGIGNYTYQWDESSDNITFTAIPLATGVVYDPPSLTDTVYYRRRVFSGTCAAEVSDTVKVIINPRPVATFAPSKSPVCEGDFFTLDFDFQNGTAPYYFDYNDGGSTISRVGADQTPVPIINYTATKTYTLTRVRDFYGCEPLSLPGSVTVPVIRLNPSFVITGPAAQCSGGTFTFEWTVDPDVEYVWIWNDGDYDTIPGNTLPSGVNQISHDFSSPNTSGDLKIPVFLSARSTISSCGPTQSKKDVTIFPAIFANAFNIETEICSEAEVEFTNLTRGGNTHRWYYRRLGVNEVLEERTFSAPTSQKYTFTNTTTTNPLIYEIVYEVSNANCNAQIIMRDTVYRGMEAAFDALSVSEYVGGNAFASFVDNTTPANDPEFRYEWEFGNGSNPTVHNGFAPPNPVRYTSIGDKEVRLTVSNIVAETNGLTCFDVESKTIKILLPPIFSGFEYTPQAACFPADISIVKNLATGDFYQWTLKRNGERLLVTNDSLPTFKIVNSGFYVIELETKNTITGQSAVSDNESTPVEIVDVPFAAFETRPQTVFAPDADGIQMYNGSSRANEYFWDFDNGGDTSTEFEPKYFYQLEGKYTITLIAAYNYGERDIDGDGVASPGEILICRDTAQSVVVAKEGGLIKIPNAFTPSSTPSGGVPNSTGRNDVFLPVMKGIEEFQMQVFDRWGTLVFESRDKNQGWDGFDRNGRMLPSGVYVYKLTLRLSNDQRTTQVGDVTLIR